MGQTSNLKDHCRFATLLPVKNGSNLWEKLSTLKESHLVQTAEFDVVQGIDHKQALYSYVKHVIKKRDRIIASISKWQTRLKEKP